MGTEKNAYASYSHPFIVAYGMIMSSNTGYIEARLQQAKAYRVPRDAWTCEPGEAPRLARNLKSNDLLLQKLESVTGIRVTDLTR